MLVYRFLTWLETAPPQARAEAVAPLVRSYFVGQRTAEEREAVDAALTVLLDDPSPDVRRTLAETLSLHEDAPRHLIVALAHDRADVSEAVFRRSPCLLEAELLQGIRRGAARTQVAIARRPWVPFAVSAALADIGCRDAVLALIANDGSDIDAEAYQAVARRFGEDPEIREALFTRADLPINVRQSVLALIVSRFAERCESEAGSEASRLQQTVRDACDRATIGLLTEADEEDLVDLVEHLRTTGQLTTQLLVRAMCAGQIRFFEAALASLSGMPATRVYAVLMSGRDAMVRSLLTKATLPEGSHPVFLIALGLWRETHFDGRPGEEKRFARQMIERILTTYQGFAPAEVDDLLALLRRLASEAAREAARAYVDAARRARLEAPVEDVIVTEAPKRTDRLSAPANNDDRQERVATGARPSFAEAVYEATSTINASHHDFEAALAAALDDLDLESAIADALKDYDLDRAYEDALRELAGDAVPVRPAITLAA